MDVKIRLLQKEDALISWEWRNNPKVWEYTLSKPNITITPEIESQWIDNVLKRDNERRYAIIVDDVYVGNIQLLDITENDAEYHIFIGDTNYWGKGIATIATNLILDVAKNDLHLKKVHLEVNEKNIAARKLYEKVGFIEVEHNENIIFMENDLGI